MFAKYKMILSWPKKCPNADFFGLYIPLLYSVNLRIHSEYRKIQTKKTPNLTTFHTVNIVKNFAKFTGKHLYWSLLKPWGGVGLINATSPNPSYSCL